MKTSTSLHTGQRQVWHVHGKETEETGGVISVPDPERLEGKGGAHHSRLPSSVQEIFLFLVLFCFFFLNSAIELWTQAYSSICK